MQVSQILQNSCDASPQLCASQRRSVVCKLKQCILLLRYLYMLFFNVIKMMLWHTINPEKKPKHLFGATHALTVIHGPGDGSTQGHIARVCGPFIGHLTLLTFFLWPKGKVHSVDHKHPVQGLQSWKTQFIKRAEKNNNPGIMSVLPKCLKCAVSRQVITVPLNHF